MVGWGLGRLLAVDPMACLDLETEMETFLDLDLDTQYEHLGIYVLYSELLKWADQNCRFTICLFNHACCQMTSVFKLTN